MNSTTKNNQAQNSCTKEKTKVDAAKLQTAMAKSACNFT